MEQVKTNSISVDEAKQVAIAVVEKEFFCNVKAIEYLGGGSFGYAYKIDIDIPP